MVHIVKRKVKGKVYLSLQRTIYSKGKIHTEYVAYLGREEDWSKNKIEREMRKHE